LTSYISRPLHVFGIPGILSVLVGFIIGLYLVLLKYFKGIALAERPLLLLSVLLILLGLQFFSIGLLGEMITFKGPREEYPEYFIERILE